jgi:hypothetical protein
MCGGCRPAIAALIDEERCGLDPLSLPDGLAAAAS